ncbi:SAM-dependent methyltransferase [Kineosporia sp. J2-2]|uniref:S-adenosyl-L-methionine-dependent methyltransferase n=1 Tax=Kineosporia corallincola TaxID=2835133 RepID=A0ABS5TGR7_9ACTN|nr:SAM-dependent methyltransferase [Kineosporia corallincola]MBT0770292.1 SAM-dependent methyltransferase [Kineosporia corallincola]
MSGVTDSLQPVSRTALWTAAARAAESRHPAALFDDPLAGALAGTEGPQLLTRYDSTVTALFVAIRTAVIDQFFRDSVCSQIVLLAAGLDTRAYRIPRPGPTEVFEVDHEALQRYKTATIGDRAPLPGYDVRHVGSDLAAGDWDVALGQAGFDPERPTLWIAEGLLFFLPETDASALLKKAHGASAPGSELVVDFTSRASLRNPYAAEFLARLAEDGNPWLFGTDQPEEFLAAAGWAATSVLEPGATQQGDDRWPYPVEPRANRYAPRNWISHSRWIADDSLA